MVQKPVDGPRPHEGVAVDLLEAGPVGRQVGRCIGIGVGIGVGVGG